LTAIADLLEQKGLLSQAEIQQAIAPRPANQHSPKATSQEWRNNLKLFTLRAELEINNHENEA
jgi:hypothetical protein